MSTTSTGNAMTIDQIITRLLENRNLTTQSAIQEFFHPINPDKLPTPFDSTPAITLIQSHIAANNKIIIYGDYDVDGVCSTAILWETLYASYPHVLPHIPHRASEGYGLSTTGIDHCLAQGAKLIITVDNGIVAHDQVAYCRAQSCDMLIIDHHEPGDTLPDANVILHSTSSCAAGLTWLFCRDYAGANLEQLALVALATICDLVPLLGPNRSFVKFGLAQLRSTTRPGLLALFKAAAIDQSTLAAYQVGFVIGPRINAAGRLEHAIDSLRLLCTKDPAQAAQLAAKLNAINTSRQDLTESSVNHALAQVSTGDLIVVSDASYHEGVIGLIAARLTEKYYRPSIAIAVGETLSRGSARSIIGFHITEHLRQFSHLLVNVGGHAAAAGFSVENSKLEEFVKLVQLVQLDKSLLIPHKRVDLEIPLDVINLNLYQRLQDFAPFGLSNPTPVFQTPGVELINPRRIGKSLQHLKFKVGGLDAIYFNAPLSTEHSALSTIAYTIDLNEYNGQSNLQLIIKQIN